MLKSDRLVCEKNATKAQPVTNCNLGSINSVYFNYKVNLLIDRGRIFVTEVQNEIFRLFDSFLKDNKNIMELIANKLSNRVTKNFQKEAGKFMESKIDEENQQMITHNCNITS